MACVLSVSLLNVWKYLQQSISERRDAGSRLPAIIKRSSFGSVVRDIEDSRCQDGVRQLMRSAGEKQKMAELE